MNRIKTTLFSSAVLAIIFALIPTFVITSAAKPEFNKRGLVEEDGKIYYYNEDGSLFTDGYKEVETLLGKTYYYYFEEDGAAFTDGYKVFTKDNKRVYYYFEKDGKAFTDGYKEFVVNDKKYHFFFSEDGSAFTDGYKEINLDGKICYFYFLPNGQGFNTGYKTVMIDGKKYYFYFDENAHAITDKLKSIKLGTRTAYMLFTADGKAFTKGYKEIKNGNAVDYYYFLSNGQAFTTGYKTVKLNNVTYYYFFSSNGKALKNASKPILFGNEYFLYYFTSDGQALVSSWKTIDSNKYYFQSNGRAAKKAFLTISGKKYYFGSKSQLVTDGWFCVGKGYYHADKNGVIATNQVLEGYKLDANGKSALKYRIIQLVNKHTTPSMSNQEKIQALYNWLLRNNMTYIRTYEHVKSSWVWKDSWVDDMATSILDNNGGNCFRYAALLGFLVREATGLEVIVYHGQTPGSSVRLTPHGWISVKQNGTWYVYDVELDKFSNYSTSSLYKVPASSSRLHLEGVGKKLY